MAPAKTAEDEEAPLLASTAPTERKLPVKAVGLALVACAVLGAVAARARADHRNAGGLVWHRVDAATPPPPPRRPRDVRRDGLATS